MELNPLGKAICQYLADHPQSSSSEIYDGIGQMKSYATVKRELNELLQQQLIIATGKIKATKYSLHESYGMIVPVDRDEYFKQDIDQRKIKSSFDFQLIQKLQRLGPVFTGEESKHLDQLQLLFQQRIAKLSKELYQKEFERLAIDLSWKSSQIEGNTYSLLETERLLKEKITASGKTQDEAIMLLNHKAAIDYIMSHPDAFQPLSIRDIEDVHSLLMKDLNVPRNIRHSRVGITGTNYRPLDNEYQIREALEDMCRLVNQKVSVFEKALFALLLISYIQPFEDGNKRTARIMSNALLIHHGYCPLSFRSVDPIVYKEAMLIFYEQNNLIPIKQLFMEQFEFAVNTYF